MTIPDIKSLLLTAAVAMVLITLSTAVTPAPTPATTVPYGGGRMGETTLETFGTMFLIAFQAEVKNPLIRVQNLDA